MTNATSILVRSEDERRTLLVGFATSLAFHALGMVAVWFLVSYSLSLNRALLEKLNQAQKPPPADRVPTIFVEVNPDQAVAEPPPDTPYYSMANSRAANPNPADRPTPKADGPQDLVPRPVEVLQPQPELLQPAPPPEVTPKIEQMAPPADLAIAKEPEPNAKPRPRTLVEARLRQGITVGPQSRQEGGVERRGAIAFDVKATPYGAYDAALIAAVQRRWYGLLDASAVALKPGAVVVTFTLHQDGQVTNVRVDEQEVGEIQALYCRKAITDPAPYAPFPEAMRRLLGRDYREVRFTFHYY